MRSFDFKLKSLYLLMFSMLLLSCGGSKKQERQEPVNGQEGTTTFYVVRHAEKLLDGSTNPPLTKEGVARSNRLVELLKEVKIAAVYATPYKRTTSTAKPLSIDQNKTIQIYDPSDNAAFLKEALKKYSGRNLLIVGHSNTVPNIVNYLTETQKYQDLEDDEYDKLFKVSVNVSGTSTVEVITF